MTITHTHTHTYIYIVYILYIIYTYYIYKIIRFVSMIFPSLLLNFQDFCWAYSQKTWTHYIYKPVFSNSLRLSTLLRLILWKYSNSLNFEMRDLKKFIRWKIILKYPTKIIISANLTCFARNIFRINWNLVMLPINKLNWIRISNASSWKSEQIACTLIGSCLEIIIKKYIHKLCS